MQYNIHKKIYVFYKFMLLCNDASDKKRNSRAALLLCIFYRAQVVSSMDQNEFIADQGAHYCPIKFISTSSASERHRDDILLPRENLRILYFH